MNTQAKTFAVVFDDFDGNLNAVTWGLGNRAEAFFLADTLNARHPGPGSFWVYSEPSVARAGGICIDWPGEVVGPGWRACPRARNH